MNSSVNTVVSSLRVRRSLTIFTRPVGMACQALMQSSVNFMRFNGIRVFIHDPLSLAHLQLSLTR